MNFSRRSIWFFVFPSSYVLFSSLRTNKIHSSGGCNCATNLSCKRNCNQLFLIINYRFSENLMLSIFFPNNFPIPTLADPRWEACSPSKHLQKLPRRKMWMLHPNMLGTIPTMLVPFKKGIHECLALFRTPTQTKWFSNGMMLKKLKQSSW